MRSALSSASFSIIVVIVVAAGTGVYLLSQGQATTITDYTATNYSTDATPSWMVSTSYVTITDTSTASNFSYATISRNTTFSYSNFGDSPNFLKDIAVTVLNCSAYRFYVSITDIPSYTGTPYNYDWNFGDNSTWSFSTNATYASTVHAYASTGKFLVDFTFYSSSQTPTRPIVVEGRSFEVLVPPSSC
jgi:hypothetical protein